MNCIFTSAGNWHRTHTWSWAPLYVVFYGEGEGVFPPGARVWKRKGMKFPNLKWWWSEVENECEYLGVFDDDLLLGDIASLFQGARESEADIFAPTGGATSDYKSLNPQGVGFREVEFIEMGMPIFKRGFLERFLGVYDPQVQDWGVDIWYSHLCQGECRMVVSDFHQIRNPPLRANGKREVEGAEGFSLFEENWLNFSRERGLPQRPPPSAYEAPAQHFGLLFLLPLVLVAFRLCRSRRKVL